MPNVVLEPLGECALTIASGPAAAVWAAALRAEAIPGVEDVVAAFDQVAVTFDPVSFQPEALTEACARLPIAPAAPSRHHVVPVFYGAGEDLPEACRRLGVAESAFIELHCGRPYTCRAIGFCPGFAYLEALNPSIAGLGRRASPRLSVKAGSVGIAGHMTGVYPLERPGGWWLVGRTPLVLVDVEDGYFPVSVGDTVSFQSIDMAGFEARQGERL